MNGSIAIVGGGVAGLTVAYELIERAERSAASPQILCFEAASRPGGNVRSERERGFVCEWGPNGFLDSASRTVLLVRRLGLAPRVERADPGAAVRFVFRSGRLRRVPETPLAFLRSDILSMRGKLRLLIEPLRRPRPETAGDESVYAFAARRIGHEAAAVLVDAMVSGVYAGNSRELSLAATFPKLRAMESTHGSLFRALLANRRTTRAAGPEPPAPSGGPAGPAGRLTSFSEGLQELTDALASALGPRLSLGVRVEGVSDLGIRGYRLHFATGAPRDVSAVVLACPAQDAAPALAGFDRALSEALAEIGSAPLAVVHTGYRRDALPDVPDGFGFLVPRGQGPRILGTLWSSNIFAGRAPAGSVLLTTMIGGATDPGAVDLDDDALLGGVVRDLRTCMGIEAQPWFVRVIRHRRGIPQYTLGHPQRLATIAARVAAHPGLWLAGDSYRGISINACVEEAPSIAEAALAWVARPAAAAARER